MQDNCRPAKRRRQLTTHHPYTVNCRRRGVNDCGERFELAHPNWRMSTNQRAMKYAAIQNHMACLPYSGFVASGSV
jgi:hypothetical protein